MSATEAVAAMRSGGLSAEEYASALLEQCERGKVLNAFITLDRDKVLAAARAADLRGVSGPLHGLPIPIKDSINTRDLPTTVGTEALRNFYPKENAPIVQKLLDAGAILLGKTNLHELSMGWTSSNESFGAVRNPYDLTRIPGGSSGGTAAAVAARMAPLGVAEDTEGSIRVPAALCGIVGFRPTTYRYPNGGTAPISSLFDQVGPHARNVGDIILFDQVITDSYDEVSPVSLKGLRLGVDRDYWFAGLDPEVARITDRAMQTLEGAGVEFVEAKVPDLRRLIQRITEAVQMHDVLQELPSYLVESGAGVTLDQIMAQSNVEFGIVSEEVYLTARDTYLPALRQTFRDYFAVNGVSAIIFPTTMAPAPKIGVDEQSIAFITSVARNIAPGSTAGLPGLVLPSGLTKDGLPVSIEIDGPAGSDRALLAMGLSIESLLPANDFRVR